MLVLHLEIGFKRQLVFNFDVKETHFSLFVILFMHMYLHICYYLTTLSYLGFHLPYVRVSSCALVMPTFTVLSNSIGVALKLSDSFDNYIVFVLKSMTS